MAKHSKADKISEAKRERLSGLPRERPTDERLDHSARVGKAEFYQAKVSAELPSTILRMRSKGTLSGKQCAAAERLLSAYEVGYASEMRGVKYAERVSGGGGSADGTAAYRLDARRAYDNMIAQLIPEVAEVVIAVVIHGAVLTAAGGYSQSYSQPRARSISAATLLGVGLLRLAG